MVQIGYGAVLDLSSLNKFLDEEYRQSYLDSHVKGSIAYQILELRQKSDLNQTEFGEASGMQQTAISRLENGENGGVNLNTLLKIANGNHVGLQVRFCDFETVLKEDVSPSGLQVETIEETIARLTPKAAPDDPNVLISTYVATTEGLSEWPTIPTNPQPWFLPGSGTSNIAMSMPMPASPT
jgi:transcriptional regulator with XRE-family HTH domain